MPAGDFYCRAEYLDLEQIDTSLKNLVNVGLIDNIKDLDLACEFLNITNIADDDFMEYVCTQIRAKFKQDEVVAQQVMHTFNKRYCFYVKLDLEVFRVEINATLRFHIDDLRKDVIVAKVNARDYTITGNILWLPFADDQSAQLLQYLRNPQHSFPDTAGARIMFKRNNIGLCFISDFHAQKPFDKYLWEIFHGVMLSFLNPDAIGIHIATQIPQHLLNECGYQQPQESIDWNDELRNLSKLLSEHGMPANYLLLPETIKQLQDLFMHSLCGEQPVLLEKELSNTMPASSAAGSAASGSATPSNTKLAARCYLS